MLHIVTLIQIKVYIMMKEFVAYHPYLPTTEAASTPEGYQNFYSDHAPVLLSIPAQN